MLLKNQIIGCLKKCCTETTRISLALATVSFPVSFMVLPLLLWRQSKFGSLYPFIGHRSNKKLRCNRYSAFLCAMVGGDQRRWRKGNLHGSMSDLISTQGRRRVESHSREEANSNPVQSRAALVLAPIARVAWQHSSRSNLSC